jgi:type I restriction enzyme R subunit
VSGKASEDTDSAIRQIVSQAISSKGLVDIFDTLGLEKPEVSPLLSDSFLNALKAMKQRNLALELLRKLINDELKARTRKNLVQSKMFSAMVEQSIRKYQNRTVEAAQVRGPSCNSRCCCYCCSYDISLKCLSIHNFYWCRF